MQVIIQHFILARWDGKRRFVSRSRVVILCSYRYPFEEILRKEDDNIEILVALLIGIAGSMIATYLIRFIDKRMHKNNRHESK